MMKDPFEQFRQSTPHYSATTAPDGRGLTLVAIDAARFTNDAHEVIATANRYGWRVTELRYRVPGANVERLTVTPSR